MGRLFADVYVDEDVDVIIATMLGARGFRAVTTHASGRLGATDTDQLTFAATNRMAFLTHNRVDFEALHRRWLEEEREHWGILIVTRRRPAAIARGLLRLLNALTADDLKNQILYL